MPFELLVGPPDSGDRHPVKITLSVRLFPRNHVLGKGKPSVAEEALLNRMMDVSTSGSPTDALPLWLPSERPAQQKLMASPDLWARNQAINRGYQRSELLGMIYYGDYTLVGVRHHTDPDYSVLRVYPMRRDASELYLTNSLHSDPFFTCFVDQLFERLERRQGVSVPLQD